MGLLMPYVSQAQERWAHTKQGESALGGKDKVAEWDHETKGMNLPPHAMAHGGLATESNMHDLDAKKAVLQQIIDMMTGHQLSGLKKKGAKAEPSVMEVSVEKHAAAPLDPKHDVGGEQDGEGDESPDVLKSLHDMYSKDDDDESADPNC